MLRNMRSVGLTMPPLSDGRLVLLEYRAEDPNVPILPDHKMTKAQVKLEVEHEGFKQSRVYDDLPWQHLFVFTKP